MQNEQQQNKNQNANGNGHNSELPNSATPQLPNSAQPSTPQLSTSPVLSLPEPEPWPERVDGKSLLDILSALLARFVVLPARAADALALWIIHTYAFQFRDISTYIGI